MMQLLVRILEERVTRAHRLLGRGRRRHVRDDQACRGCPIAAALFGFLVFMSILTVQFFDMAGATQLFGPLLFLQSMRTFTMWIDSMVVAGVIGTALTADVGARKVREEIDAMDGHGHRPHP